MKKIVLGALTLATALCLFGCSGESQQPEEPKSTEPAGSAVEESTPQDISIIESGWSAGESGYVYYGIGIENPNSAFEAQFPTIKVTGKDADGKILFSNDQTLNFMLPGAKYYYGGQAGNGTAPATVEFSVSVSDRNWVANDKQSMEIYTIENANEVVGEYGNVNYTGEITVNEELRDVNEAMVNAILRDSAGNIVAGYTGFAEVSKAGDTTVFDISAYDVPEHASFEIYAQPWM